MAATVGEQLRQARTERGLTLEQVTEAIHLRQAYLEALENDQRSELPSNVQGRGYLRLYAGFLNLPEKPLLDAWEGKRAIEGTPAGSDESEPGNNQSTTEVEEGIESPAAPPIAPAPTGPADFRSAQLVEATSSQAIFVEIGQKLLRQREALGLSLAEVERYTRLRQHYLQALEEGRMEKLPSPVQGRGMLSNYAAFLNLNEDELLLRFAEGLQQRRLERIPTPETLPTPTKKRPVRQASPFRQFLTPDVLFGVVVVGAILFFTIRTAASISTLRAQESQPTARAIAEVLLMTPTSSLDPAETAVEGGSMAITPSPPMVSQAPQATNAPNGDGDGLSETEPPTTGALPAGAAVETSAAQVTIAPINDDPLQVYIVARQRAWLKITIDNKELFNGRVVPGNAYAYSGTRRIELLTGNAAALQVFYNQQDLGTLGIAGQVAALVFVPEGVQTPTATVTFTPTTTPLATVTPTPTTSPQVTQSITPFVP